MATTWRQCARLALVFLALLPAGARAGDAPEYAYQATRDLVSLVDRAARMVESDGEAAFKAFAVRNSDWFHGDTYIFVYELDGTCVFHAETPDLVGRNLIDLRDVDGKPMIRYITDIGRQPAPDAAGWVFYLWQDVTSLSPRWKSAYVRKAVAPDGMTYVVGSGLYDIKIERAFVEERVERAVDLLKTKGSDAAFAAFRDISSPFDFLGAYIFVLDASGHTLVDPAFPNETGRNLSAFRDAVGLEPISELLDKLKGGDSAWVQYLWTQPGQANLTRRLIYARKVVVDGRTLIVGSDYVLSTPIWMRVEEGRPWQNDRLG
jgi:signal transduction histidine kinase